MLAFQLSEVNKDPGQHECNDRHCRRSAFPRHHRLNCRADHQGQESGQFGSSYQMGSGNRQYSVHRGVWRNGSEDEPYTSSTGILVAVVKTDTITYVQIFYPKNNTIQYVEISDTEATRKDAKLVNMETVANMVTVVDNTSDDSHYPSAKAVYDAIEALRAELQSST